MLGDGDYGGRGASDGQPPRGGGPAPSGPSARGCRRRPDRGLLRRASGTSQSVCSGAARKGSTFDWALAHNETWANGSWARSRDPKSEAGGRKPGSRRIRQPWFCATDWSDLPPADHICARGSMTSVSRLAVKTLGGSPKLLAVARIAPNRSWRLFRRSPDAGIDPTGYLPRRRYRLPLCTARPV